jgi:hypothetical protein
MSASAKGRNTVGRFLSFINKTMRLVAESANQIPVSVFA